MSRRLQQPEQEHKKEKRSTREHETFGQRRNASANTWTGGVDPMSVSNEGNRTEQFAASAAKPTAEYLAGLNPQQREAVEYGIRPGKTKGIGPLLVIAGAGSGKTKVLTCRAGHLLANDADPAKILLLTFSRRAAKEMTQRVRRIAASVLKNQKVHLPWAGTFHAIGARLLREYAHQIGLSPSFTIHDRSDLADLMDVLRHDLGQSKKERPFPKKDTCLAIYSLVVNSGVPLKIILSTRFPWCAEWEDGLRTLFATYSAAKRRQNVLDYDDLLLHWAEMLKDKDIAAEIGSRFDHILVDEYQDTNRLQERILLRLKPDGRGLTVVGDDAQAIYSVRAATVRNILDYPDRFKPKAHIITLEQNYRSVQPILYACNKVMEFAQERYTKNLFSERQSQQKPYLTTVADEAAQARYVAKQILKAREAGVPFKEQAVLVRAGHHSAQLELELDRRKIPYVKHGGLKFLEAAHIKDVVSVLRWCENAKDRVAGFRVLKLLPGIGPSTAAKILDEIAAEGGKVIRVLKRLTVPKATAEVWPAFRRLIAGLRNAENWPAEFELVRIWYEPHLQRLHDDADTRSADIAQLQQIAAGNRSRQQFLTELTLEPPDATSGDGSANRLEEDYVILATIHWAKGGEWKVVRVLNVVEGCIPSSKATRTADEVEEELRLLHVAMTRAEDELDLIMPQRLFMYQQNGDDSGNVNSKITRFLPKSVHHAFERKPWDDSGGAPSSGQPKWRSQSIDVVRSAEDMWR
jgi:DNA helicase-2/ATP-dependent DNA helicase PcrA